MVANWRSRESIPAKHIPIILKAARELGIKLSYADFFEDAA